MRKILIKILLISFLFLPFTIAAQVSTLGKDFWVGYMEIVPNSIPLQKLYISSQVNTSVTVSMPVMSWTQTYNVVANQITTVVLPSSARTTSIETIAGTGVNITSNDLISVFAAQESSARTEASVVLPTNALGGTTEYYIASYQGVLNATGGLSTPSSGIPPRSEFLVVAYQDNTEILITPSANTSTGRLAGTTFSITLNKGQTYQVQGVAPPAASLSDYKPYDLTGTRLVGASGCKPFAVFSGANATITNSGCMAWEHIYEQQFPIQTWGNFYLVSPFKNSNAGYLYRVIASQDNTAITVNGLSAGTLNKGQFIEREVGNNSPNCVEGNKPIAVAQYIKGQDCNGVPTQPGGGGGSVNVGDPAMIMLNPASQTINKITYNTIASENMLPPNPALYFVNIVTKTANASLVKLNGSNVGASNFSPFPCGTYSYAQIQINSGTHNLESDSSFIAYHYGYGRAEGYAYSVGASFNNLARNFNMNPGAAICVGQAVNVSGFGTDILSYTWDFGEPNATATGQTASYVFNNPGTYNIKMTVATQGGCGTDVITKPLEVLPYPVVNLGVDRTICLRTTTQLDAGTYIGEPITYTWSTGATTRTINVGAGTYTVFVKNKADCQSNTATINITNYPETPVDITNVNPAYCIDEPSFAMQATPVGGTFTLNNVAVNTLNPLTLGVGSHRAIYTYQNPTNLCINKDTVNFVINPLPAPVLNGKFVVCALNIETYSIQDAFPQTRDYQWNVVGGTILSGQGTGTISVGWGISATGTISVKEIILNTGCNKTITQNITINPLPILQFSNLQNAYCIDEPIVNLSATPTGGTFNWLGSTQNINRIKIDSLGVGTYTLRYIYTDANGCKNSITNDITINPLPQPIIENLRSIYCTNQPTFNLTGTPAGGVFTINDNVQTQFNANALGIGNYTVNYTYRDANSCVKTVSKSVEIKPTPIVEVTGLQFVYCINSNAFDLTANPAPLNEGGIGIFTINGNPTPITQVNPATLGAGIHSVLYTFTANDTQCVQTATKTFEVSNLPAVALVNIAGIKDKYCLNEPAVNLTGAGTPAGGIFSIDGNIKTQLNPSDADVGVGNHTLLYNFRDVNNCFNVASRTFEVLPLPATKITNLNNNYCVQLGSFQMIGTPAGGTFTIDGAASNGSFNPNLLGLGIHIVTYTEPKGCVTFTKEVEVREPLPPPTIIDPKVCSFSGNFLTLDAGEAKTFLWSNNLTTQTINVFNSGTYSVLITDSLGCKTTGEFIVKEDCTPKVFFPTAFSPNGDNLNDTYEVFGKDIIAFEMIVYSRWGEIVYVSYDYREQWDGTRNGMKCPDGSYIIDVKYKELPARIPKTFRGALSIVR
ncbi:MAG: PKD domain-containing protein [Bacteroidetes bacterium]|nr:MAG: PKD domain-containing protein [Bacteroidota bacterium]